MLCELNENKIEDEQCAGNCKNVNLITMIKQGKPEEVILKTAVDRVVLSVFSEKQRCQLQNIGLSKFVN